MSDSDFEDLSIHIPNEELVIELKQKDKLLKQKETENQQLIQNLIQQKQQNSKLVKDITEKNNSIRVMGQNIFVLSQKILEIDNQRMAVNGKLIDAQVEHKKQKERLLNQNSSILSELQSTLGELYHLKNEHKSQSQQNIKKKSVLQEQLKQTMLQKQKSIQITSLLKLQIQSLKKRSADQQNNLKNKTLQTIKKLQFYKTNQASLQKKIQQLTKQFQQSQNKRVFSQKTVQELQQKLIVQRQKQDNLASQTLLYEEFVKEIKKQEEINKKLIVEEVENFKNKNKDLQAKLESIKKELELQSIKLFELYKKNNLNDTQINGLKESNESWKKNYEQLQEHCIQIEESLTAKDKQQKLQRGYATQLEQQLKRMKARVQQVQFQKQNDSITLKKEAMALKNETMTLKKNCIQFQEQIKVLKETSLSQEDMEQYNLLRKLVKTMEDQNKELVKDYKAELQQKKYQIETMEQNVCIVQQTNMFLEKELKSKLQIIANLESRCLVLEQNLQNYRLKQSQSEAKARSQLQSQILELNKKIQSLQMKKSELQSNIQDQNKQLQESNRRQAQLEKQYDSIITDLINQNNKNCRDL